MAGQVEVMVFLGLNQDVQVTKLMDGIKAGDFKIWRMIVRAIIVGQENHLGHI